MSTTLVPSRASSGNLVLWDELARRVCDYDPTVVVLIARKAPRIAQALNLSFGHSPLIISDLALPLSRRELSGARVAIVDDVVNVGSTLTRAYNAVSDAGASEVRTFVLARRECRGGQAVPGEIEVIVSRPLDSGAVDQFANHVPTELQGLMRPYDLDFPLLTCSIHTPGEPFATAFAALVNRYGTDQVYDLTTTEGAEAGLRRLSVDIPVGDSVFRKLRLFIRDESGECVLVPICIGTPLQTGPPDEVWARDIWDALPSTEEHEAKARIRIFLDSLELGFRFLRQHQGLLSADPWAPLDREEAELVLGPHVADAALSLRGWSTALTWRPLALTAGVEPPTSPFFQAAREQGLIEAVGQRSAADELSVFHAFFNELAGWVGADDPSSYKLEWPYSTAEIAADPYLRLRIGPTAGDLAAIIGELVPDLAAGARHAVVSRLLDREIDHGSVVPTIGRYDGDSYRIYRKGEKNPRDDLSLRTRRALQAYDKPLSLTRISKLATILAFTHDSNRSDVTVKTEERGNVLCYSGSVLHSETELSHYLLRTKQLRLATGADSSSRARGDSVRAGDGA